MTEDPRLAARGAYPTVSVIMAVYNGASYLDRAADSILNQTLADLELVVVDDGSTDRTPLVLDSYRDSRVVRLVNRQNVGLTRALNRGIAVSSGRFLARQDADDWSLPTRLERQVAFLEGHPTVGLVGSGSRWIDGQGTLIRDWLPPTEPAVLHAALLRAIPFLHGTFLFRRACLENLDGGYDESFPVAQDCDLLLRLSESWDVANLPEILYTHRRHGDTITARRTGEQEHFLKLARQAAVRRRLAYGWARLGLRDGRSLPSRLGAMSRRRLAQRYTWWAAGARALGRGVAFRFLLTAFLLDPMAPELHAHLRRILRRKVGSRRAEVHTPRDPEGRSGSGEVALDGPLVGGRGAPTSPSDSQ